MRQRGTLDDLVEQRSTGIESLGKRGAVLWIRNRTSWQPYIMDRATVEALGYFGGIADERVLEQFAAGLQSMGERTDRRIPDGDDQR